MQLTLQYMEIFCAYEGGVSGLVGILITHDPKRSAEPTTSKANPLKNAGYKGFYMKIL